MKSDICRQHSGRIVESDWRQNILATLKFSNISTAFASFGVSFLITWQSSLEVKVECHIFIFLSTLLVYNLDHGCISEADKINAPHRTEWFVTHKKSISAVNTICLLAAVFILVKSKNLLLIKVCGLNLIICMLYSFSSFIKQIPGLKNIITALIWSSAVVILPVLWYAIPLNQEIGSAFSLCFLIALINTILNDIHDIKGDLSDETKSIPVVFGINRTSRLCLFLALTALFLTAQSGHPLGYVLCILTYIAAIFENSTSTRYWLDTALLLIVAPALPVLLQ